MFIQRSTRVLKRLPERGPLPIQLSTHPQSLGALTREEPRLFAAIRAHFAAICTDGHLTNRARLERPHQLLPRAHCERQPMLVVCPLRRQAVREVARRLLTMHLDMR